MLDPTMRQLLFDCLRPPQGARLESAVATTFTLDLTAAMLPPLAFTSFGLEDRTSDPVALLESIRRAAERVTIFCQAGMIGVPQQAPDLATFLEPMVKQVTPPRGGLFHPKIWLLKFLDEAGTPAYRLLVMSRNLTHDSSWDLVVRLDSVGVAASALTGNDELSSFVGALARVNGLSARRRRIIESLARDVHSVEWEFPDGVESLRFHHLHPDAEPIDWRATRVCVVSPFVNDSGVQAVTKDARERHLVARPGQLDLLAPGTLRDLQTYVLDPAAGGVPPAEGRSEDQPAPVGMNADLHAKLYVLEPAGNRWSRARVLIGSANATSAALGANVEFMVEMVGAITEFGIDTVLGDDAALRPFLREYPTEGGHQLSEREEVEAQVEAALRMIAARRHRVHVETSPEGKHVLRVTVDGPYPERADWQCQVGLLTRPGRAQGVKLGTAPSLLFEDVDTSEVTAFVTVRVTAPLGVEVTTVVVADLVGAPRDRLDKVIARQIDTPEKLMRLIRMLLDFGNPDLLPERVIGKSRHGEGASATDTSGALELVLRALSSNPTAIDSIDDLMRRLEGTTQGRDAMPPGWADFWTTVRAARKQVGS